MRRMNKKEENNKGKETKIGLPKELLDDIRGRGLDPSEYIEELVKNDLQEKRNSDEKPNNEVLKEAELVQTKEKKRQEIIEEAMLEFLKKYRKEEWIEYMLKSRGEEAIKMESKRIVDKHPQEWSDFIREYSKE